MHDDAQLEAWTGRVLGMLAEDHLELAVLAHQLEADPAVPDERASCRALVSSLLDAHLVVLGFSRLDGLAVWSGGRQRPYDAVWERCWPAHRLPTLLDDAWLAATSDLQEVQP